MQVLETSRSNNSTAKALETARTEFVSRNPKSRTIYEEATNYLPGGNTRSSLFYEPFPLAIVSGSDCRMSDADGHEYIDFLGEFTAGIYGHSNPTIRMAIEKAVKNGINFSSQGPLELELAKLLCDRFPSLERVRFTNSGSEASMMALSLARVHTKRTKIVVFEGAYHGGPFSFVGKPAPSNMPFEFLIAAYNDQETTSTLLEGHASNIAAIVVEPMQGAGGCIPADRSFLEFLREFSNQNGALLIFDEVMTSRLHPNGIQGMFGVIPDLTILGKYIGGGMPIGAFGGRADLMQHFDPRNPNALPHAGTFNNNVVTLSAGIAGLSNVYTALEATNLNARGDSFRTRLNDICNDMGVPVQFTGCGSVMNMHVVAGRIRNFRDTQTGSTELRDLIFFDLIERGIYLARRGLIALSMSIGDAEIETFVDTFSDTLALRRPLLTEQDI